MKAPSELSKPIHMTILSDDSDDRCDDLKIEIGNDGVFLTQDEVVLYISQSQLEQLIEWAADRIEE